MRTQHLNLSSSVAGLTAGLFLAAAPSGLSQALPPSPVGTWDCVVSGSQQGVAFLSFNKDFSINGYEVLTFRQSVPSIDPRNPVGIDNNDRGGLITTNASGTSSNSLFIGFGPIQGFWGFDLRGRTVGFFTEGSELADQSLSPSFVAVVKPGKHMSLTAVDSPNPSLSASQPRRCVFQGIPFAAGANLEGSWMASGAATSTTSIQPGGRFVEFYSLSNAPSLLSDPNYLETFWPLTNSPAVSNSFFLFGNGPGYTNFGLALLSNQKKLAIVTLSTSLTVTNSDLRSVVGPYNPAKRNGNLNGIDENFVNINQKVAPAAVP